MDKKFRKGIWICIAIIALIVVFATYFISNIFNINQNIEVADINGAEIANADAVAEARKATINTPNGEFLYSSDQLIVKACELLGTPYAQVMDDNNRNYGKGVKKSPWTNNNIITKEDFYSSEEILNRGIDCSGLVYWSLSSLYDGEFGTRLRKNQRTDIDGDTTGAVSNAGAGFSTNNPVPIDTTHWLTYYDGINWPARYWSEIDAEDKQWQQGSISIFHKDYKPVIMGKHVNVLKIEDEVDGPSHRYYDYLDENNSWKELPAGTIVVANAQAHPSKYTQYLQPGQELDDHMWITLGNLGTNDPEVVKNKLENMGVSRELLNRTYKDNNGNDCPVVYNVKKTNKDGTVENSTNEYWRIESAGGVGVVINNGDPETEVIQHDYSAHSNRVKAIGPIWAFQIVNDVEGDYSIALEKTDSDGKGIKIENNSFDVYFNTGKDSSEEARLEAKEESAGYRIDYKPVNISETGYEFINISEISAPNGYDRYNKKIELKINKVYSSELKKYTGQIEAIKVDENNDGFSNDSEISADENGVFTSNDGQITVSMVDNVIVVSVKDKRIDLALKKRITKVKKAGSEEFIPVSEANKFNVGRDFSEAMNTVQQFNEIEIGPLKDKTDTNAIYWMNKTPVEVCKGDEVQYSIRVYNEGEVAAKANIADYIPVGLEFLKVTFKDHDGNEVELSTEPTSDLYYLINNENGVLNIWDNSDSPDSYINEFNGENLEYKEFIVTCRVKDDAEGVLTNVAEIIGFKIHNNNENNMPENGTIRDIDSTPNNWQSPNGDDPNAETDKGTEAWRNYSNNNDDKLDRGWHHEFLAQDKSVVDNRVESENNQRQGDDDDFEKVIIIERGYNCSLKKVDSSDNSEVQDIKFNITRNNGIKGTGPETFENVTLAAAKEGDHGKLRGDDSGTITYIIEEQPLDNYIQIKGPIQCDLNIEKGKIISYNISYGKKDGAEYETVIKDVTDTEKIFKYKADNNVELTIKVVVDYETGKVEMVLDNRKIKNTDYALRFRKVSSADNAGLEGVTFKVEHVTGYADETTSDSYNTEEVSLNATDSEGYTNIVNGLSEIKPWGADIYYIKEIDLGENTGFVKLEHEIEVKVNTGMKETGETYVSGYDVIYDEENKIHIDENDPEDSFTIVQNEIKYVIRAKLENIDGAYVLTVTIPNVPDIPVPLMIRKIAENNTDSDPLKDAEIKVYKNNGTEDVELSTITNEDGTISYMEYIAPNTSQLTYIVKEKNAPFGYDNEFYNSRIILDVIYADGEISEVKTRVETKNNTTNEFEKDEELSEKVLARSEVINEVKTVVLDIKNKETDKPVDLALKKIIKEIDGIEVISANNIDEKYDRQAGFVADATPIVENGTQDAEYKLNKTPVAVRNGSTIKYEIRIYNESIDVAATASKIKDYLPDGLELQGVYYGETKLNEGEDEDYTYENNTLTINALSELINPINVEQKSMSYDSVIVECKVLDTAKGFLTNVAEITEYTTLDGVIERDRDSEPNNWENPVNNDPAQNDVANRNSKRWIEYTGKIGNSIESGKFKNYKGQQDDDDFEKVIVVEDIDLVLKKIITQIGDKNINDYEAMYKRFSGKDGDVEVSVDKLNSDENITTAEYKLNKTPVIVGVGDTVTYQIRIYNEGSVLSTASEIKDYIPNGLTFKSVSYNGTVLTDGYEIDENNVLTIKPKADGEPVIPLIPAYDGVCPKYDYITVTCEVNGNVRGVLTNVAEITKYKTISGETTKDRDSKTIDEGEWKEPDGSNKNTLEGKSGKAWNDYYSEVSLGVIKDYPGQEDDDDFEKICVAGGYKLRIKKVDSFTKRGLSGLNEEGLQGAEFVINGDSKITDKDGIVEFGPYALGIEGSDGVLGKLDTFTIQEKATKEGYSKLGIRANRDEPREMKDTFTLFIEQTLQSNGLVKLNGYILNLISPRPEGDAIIRRDVINKSATYYTKDEDGNIIPLMISVSEDKEIIGNYIIELRLGNEFKEKDYEVCINKVDENGENVSDVKFNISADNMYRFYNNLEFNTDGGPLNLGKYKITSKNYREVDTFTINEIQAKEKMYGLEDSITLKVYKGLSEDGYMVTKMKLVTNGNESDEGTEVTLQGVKLKGTSETVDVVAKLENNIITVTIPNKEETPPPPPETPKTGKYSVILKKVKKDGTPIESSEAIFNINGSDDETEKGILKVTPEDVEIKSVEQEDTYTIKETKAPDGYKSVSGEMKLNVKFKEENKKFVIDEDNTTFTVENKENKATIGISSDKTTITIIVPNEEEETPPPPETPKIFDLALRKFITKVNDSELVESREPQVDVSKLISGESTSAEYTHSKSPVLVTKNDIVEYTIRVYNEGEVDGYASLVMDDIPEGVEMILPDYNPDGTSNNINAQYRWVMYRKVHEGEDVSGKETITYDEKEYVIVDNVQEAEVIVTDYLSQEVGEKLKTAQDSNNPNLLKAFNPDAGKMTEDNYRDLKVQFKVIETEEKKLVTNHAQITKQTDGSGTTVKDRDSTPNVWEKPPRDDDQDYDVIEVGKFDLALYKWVSTAIVTENGKTTEYPSNHTQDDKSNVVNVSIQNDKLNDVNVKFKYRIKVENQGTIAGKALEVKEHIPEGLKFVEEDNKEFGWVDQKNGTATTEYLKDTILQPGQTAEVTIVLTWINGSSNFGKKVNFAEISKDENEFGWPDIDSTPNNFKDTPKEDDEDEDVVYLQIKTGIEGVMYVVIGLAVMAIISGGIFGIKKFVINK